MTISYLTAKPLLSKSTFSIHIYCCKENKTKEANRKMGGCWERKFVKKGKNIMVRKTKMRIGRA